MRSEATAHRHRDPPPHNKYGKSQVHKTRNDLIDTISKVIYRSWLCLPLITHFWTGSLSIISFIASSCESAPFCFKGSSEALLTNPLSQDAPALFCFSYTFFVPSHPLSAFSLSLRRCLLPTGKPLPSPSPFPAWKHSVSHKPRPTWAWTKPPSCSCPQVLCQIPAWTHLRPAAPVSALSPPRHLCRGDTKEPQCHHHQLPPPSRNSSGYSSPQNPMVSERDMAKKAETALGSTTGIPPCPRQPLSKERTSAAGKCPILPWKCHGDQP